MEISFQEELKRGRSWERPSFVYLVDFYCTTQKLITNNKNYASSIGNKQTKNGLWFVYQSEKKNEEWNNAYQ